MSFHLVGEAGGGGGGGDQQTVVTGTEVHKASLYGSVEFLQKLRLTNNSLMRRISLDVASWTP